MRSWPCYGVLVILALAAAAGGFTLGLAWTYVFAWAADTLPLASDEWRSSMRTAGEFFGLLFSLLLPLTAVVVVVFAADTLLEEVCDG